MDKIKSVTLVFVLETRAIRKKNIASALCQTYTFLFLKRFLVESTQRLLLGLVIFVNLSMVQWKKKVDFELVFLIFLRSANGETQLYTILYNN